MNFLILEFIGKWVEGKIRFFICLSRCWQALKALILERMGKNEEALTVCLNAKEILCTNDSNVFVDDLTLSTLQIVFQRLDHC